MDRSLLRSQVVRNCGPPVTARDLWCWGCHARKRQVEISADVWTCIDCGSHRDFTDPDELKGICGE